MTAKNMTAREALISILQEKGMTKVNGTNKLNANAKIVIYFPAGDYVLHNDDDNTRDESKQKDAVDSKNNNVSSGIEIYGGNFVIKGDGPDKTRLIMETPNLPTSISNLSSSPILLAIKHTNGPNNAGNSPKLASVTENAKRGDFTVKVSGTTGISSGQWVQLRLRSGDRELVKKEIGPIALNENWAIAKAPISINQSSDDLYGVKITEFHQVKSAANGKITFYEPIMHDIDIKYNDTEGWEIRTYKYLENVGIEDLSFVGNALDGYAHHGEGHAEQAKVGWQYDGAYKPLLLQRVVNSCGYATSTSRVSAKRLLLPNLPTARHTISVSVENADIQPYVRKVLHASLSAKSAMKAQEMTYTERVVKGSSTAAAYRSQV